MVRNLTNDKEPPMKVKVIADIEILKNLDFPEVNEKMENVQGLAGQKTERKPTLKLKQSQRRAKHT